MSSSLLKKYFNRQELVSLSININFPKEIVEEIDKTCDLIDLETMENDFELIFSSDVKISDTAAISIDLNGKKMDMRFSALIIYLTAALCSKDTIYKYYNIPDTVFYDTMKAMPRFMNERLEAVGEYAFDRAFWISRQLSGRLFRIGMLEFCMSTYRDKWRPTGIRLGDPIISIHVPSDALLDQEELYNSYHAAQNFFHEFFPDFHYVAFYTRTWMLSPTLKTLLSENSSILKFQKNFKILWTQPNEEEFLRWVFKKYGHQAKEYDIKTLPEDTSLQRNLKLFILQGGIPEIAGGILYFDKLSTGN